MNYAHPSNLTIAQIERGIKRAKSAARMAALDGRYSDQTRYLRRIYRLECELERR